MLLALVGGAAGALLALWGVDWLRASIPEEIGGIRPTFAGTAFVLAAVAAIASYVPARRAGRLDPMRALRDE